MNRSAKKLINQNSFPDFLRSCKLIQEEENMELFLFKKQNEINTNEQMTLKQIKSDSLVEYQQDGNISHFKVNIYLQQLGQLEFIMIMNEAQTEQKIINYQNQNQKQNQIINQLIKTYLKYNAKMSIELISLKKIIPQRQEIKKMKARIFHNLQQIILFQYSNNKFQFDENFKFFKLNRLLSEIIQQFNINFQNKNKNIIIFPKQSHPIPIVSDFKLIISLFTALIYYITNKQKKGLINILIEVNQKQYKNNLKIIEIVLIQTQKRFVGFISRSNQEKYLQVASQILQKIGPKAKIQNIDSQLEGRIIETKIKVQIFQNMLQFNQEIIDQ